jgi:hypothetical protein
VNSYGAQVGGIVGVIGGRERPQLSADSTAIANICLEVPLEVPILSRETLCGPPIPLHRSGRPNCLPSCAHAPFGAADLCGHIFILDWISAT